MRPPSLEGVAELVAVMDRLRSPGGCPWDREQTHASLLPYLLEEAFELVEAVETGTREDLLEELGDVLLQVVFHARVAQEDPEAPFDIDDVARRTARKLVARHPHVFAEAHAPDAEAVRVSWEALKKAEKQRESVFDGVPVALPALARAAKIAGRAERTGITVAVEGDGPGERLLRLALEVRAAGGDPETALREALRHWEDALRRAERDEADGASAGE